MTGSVSLKRVETSLPDVPIIEPTVFGDERGFFLESFHRDKFEQMGISANFVQDNHSRSRHGVLRGLHYQLGRPQAKLIRVVSGKIFDVAVDVRRGSPTFGRWAAAELSDDNKRMLFVPVGFAHGFYVMSETADMLYKCTDLYAPEQERGIVWDDPALEIHWPLVDPEPILSPKDGQLPTLSGVPESDLPQFGS